MDHRLRVLSGNLEVLGGAGANSLAQIDPVVQDIQVNGSVIVQGGSGVNAIAQIVSQGTQNITATGDINVIGGTGAGAEASIIAIGIQDLFASGSIVLTQNAGGARIGGASRATPPGSTGSVLSLYDSLYWVFGGIGPDEDSDPDAVRRMPICF